LNFVAIDLKAANFQGKESCSIGIAVVENKIIVSTRAILIKSDDIESKAEFIIVWNELRTLLEKNLVVAFNANKQINLLLSILDNYKIQRPILDFACSRFISKKLWRDLNNYKLSTIADNLGIKYKEESVEKDAVICSEIFLKALQEMKVSSSDMLHDSLGLKLGHIIDTKYIPVSRKISYQRIGLRNKNVVFTGTLQSMVRREAMKKVISIGGFCSSSVNQNTDVLVIGVQSRVKLRGKSKSSKMMRAERLKKEGKDILIISEDEFLRII